MLPRKHPVRVEEEAAIRGYSDTKPEREIQGGMSREDGPPGPTTQHTFLQGKTELIGGQGLKATPGWVVCSMGRVGEQGE